MSAYGTHWCFTCHRRRWFDMIDGDVVCSFCNMSFIQDLNELDEQWGWFYEAARRGRFHLADTTIDDIFNLEDHHHGLRRTNDTVDSSTRQEPRMDDQIDHSNHPALPSDSSNSLSDSLQTIRITQSHVQDGLNCVICLDQFQVGHEVLKTPCKHLYHYHCIVLWLVQSNSCPICRCDMLPQSI